MGLFIILYSDAMNETDEGRTDQNRSKFWRSTDGLMDPFDSWPFARWQIWNAK